MKRYINIKGQNQKFPYIIEYKKGNTISANFKVKWCNDNGIIRLHEDDIQYYRDTNDWYSVDNLTSMTDKYIPSDEINLSKVTVYIPTHSISAYAKGIKYVLTVNTWINGLKVDLGSFMFKPNDTYAIPGELIKNGNNEYYSCIDFDIIDPFYLIYSDKWLDFRHNACREPKNINTLCSYLNISLFVVDEYNNRYLINNDWLGGCTNFDISNVFDYLTLNLVVNNDPIGFKFDLTMNETYDWFLDYLYETYNIRVSHSDIKFELILKNKDGVIIGPQMTYVENNSNSERYNPDQIRSYEFIKSFTQPTLDEAKQGIID
jgi:hypothetical protein